MITCVHTEIKERTFMCIQPMLSIVFKELGELDHFFFFSVFFFSYYSYFQSSLDCVQNTTVSLESSSASELS